MNYSRDGLAKNIVGINNPMQGALVRLVRLSLLGCLFGYFWVGNLVLLGEQPTVLVGINQDMVRTDCVIKSSSI